MLPPYPTCPIYQNAATLGGAATALIVIAFINSLLAGIFAALRICRIKARLALSGPPSSAPPTTTKPCHTRGVATILLTVFAFVLFLVGSILGWVGVPPLSLVSFSLCPILNAPSYSPSSYSPSYSPLSFLSCSIATGAGSALAGIVIATSFIAMVLDASSHCCCKTVKSVASPSGTTIIVTGAHHQAPPYHAAAATYWRKATDGKETWFVQDGTGQTAWVLPAGGVLVG